MNDGKLWIKTKIDNSGFNAQIKATERKLNDLKATLEDHQSGYQSGFFHLTEIDVIDLNKEIERTTNQLNKLKKKQLELDSKGLKDVKNTIDGMGKSTADVIKKIGKWTLAIFGVRSAYLAVISVANSLSQYNKQIGTDLEYIRYMMAVQFEGIIKGIIDLVYKLMTYVKYLAKEWFGINLFTKKQSDGFKKTNKEAKKLENTLTDFDSINKLPDNSNSSTISLPSQDLGSIGDDKIPPFLEWIKDHGDLVRIIIEGIALAILKLKLNLNLLQGIGILLLLESVYSFIKDIKDLIEDPTWEKFGKVIKDIGLAIFSLGLILGSFKLGVIGLIIFVVGLVIENWDTIKEIIIAGLDTIWSVIKLFVSIITGIFTTLINILTNPFIILKETVFGVFDGIKTTIQGVFKVIKSLFTGDWKGVMSGFKQIFKGTFDTIWSIAKAPLNLIIGGINALIKGANKISFDVPDWVPGLGGKKFGFHIPEIKKLATGGIIDLPKRGVPLASNVIGGEAGAEGVLPLTNESTMSRLGKEIGRYVTVDITNLLTMNGRVLLKELSKIESENSFSRNGV